MSDHQDAPLSDLCSICHTNPPKYRCPRCSTKTCSLPCTKRHKLWSQCSGIRDPGAYLKRSELATPKAFDQDFNFIAGVEMKIERAGVDAGSRGVDLYRHKAPGFQGNRNKLEKGEAGLMKGFERIGVIVDRAPRGMTRSKINRTRWLPRSKQVTWTVEWRDGEGSEVQHDCPETFTLQTLHDGFLSSKEPHQRKAKKMKTNHPTSKIEPATIVEQEPVPQVTVDDSQDPESEDQDVVTDTNHSPTLNFYLQRPYTPSSQPTILIPLSSSETLASALSGRVLLEFPTIYILQESADKLLAGFMTEEDYLKGSDKVELARKTEGVEDREDLEEGEVSFKGIDERKVLEVLKMDLGVAS